MHIVLHSNYWNGINIFDKTEASRIIYGKRGVKIITDKGFSIQAKHLIYANGYEAQNYLKEPYGRLHSTYVAVSEPLDRNPFNFILWESARPYFYMRTTSDNRIIIGGKDEVFYSPGKRNSLLTSKTKQLEKAFQKKFPEINFITDYCWTGTFAETKDGLPYIGKHKDHPFSFFSLGYGGNGITFSLIAAKIIANAILKKKSPDQNIFSFYR
jgi:glycine/D-amino acid oxidase-like deaminating enzyme